MARPQPDLPSAGQNLDELFDVVDDHDEVIAQAPRREVHARRLKHRAIHVLVFGSDGRVFLQKRSLAKDSSPGLWDSSCSGHLDAGESYDQAAQRELFEEIGLRLPAPPERWFRIEACPDTGWEFVWVYRTFSDGPFHLNPSEIETGAWYVRAQLSEVVAADPFKFTRPFRFIWKKAAEKAEELKN